MESTPGCTSQLEVVAPGPPRCYAFGTSPEAGIDELLERLAADASAARAMRFDLAAYLLDAAVLELIQQASQDARKEHTWMFALWMEATKT